MIAKGKRRKIKELKKKVYLILPKEVDNFEKKEKTRKIKQLKTDSFTYYSTLIC